MFADHNGYTITGMMIMMKQDVEMANKEWRDEEINSDRHIENKTGMIQYGRPIKITVYLLIMWLLEVSSPTICGDLMCFSVLG